jgi:hypothetical protein
LHCLQEKGIEFEVVEREETIWVTHYLQKETLYKLKRNG